MKFVIASPQTAAPEQLGSIRRVEPVIALPDVVTFHIPTVMYAVPRAGLSGSMNLAWNVHVPAGKDTPPAPSTIHPFAFGVVSGPGSAAVTLVGAGWSYTPGEKSSYSAGGGLMSVPMVTRFCACGNTGCVAAVALSIESM